MEHSATQIIMHVIDTLSGMIWQIYWPLAFGLMLSSLLRHILPVDQVIKHLGHTNIKSLTLVTLLGMVSSSCSYAAASLSKTLLTKKASLPNAMAFLVASTNLILEMFIVLVSLLGWYFLWGEIIGGIILIIIVAIVFHFYPKVQLDALEAKIGNSPAPAVSDCGMDMSSMKKDNTDEMASMSGSDMDMSSMKKESADDSISDCGMDMSKESMGSMDMGNMDHSTPSVKDSSFNSKLKHSAGFFQMDISMIGREILIGVVISSLLIALVPQDWWRDLFIDNQTFLPAWLHSLLDVVIGIFVAVIAYVCSVGNLLLAAALWHGGISFGGVMGFILADVITIPMTQVYKNYYGVAPARWIVASLFISILATGLILDVLFSQVDWSASKEALRTLHQAGFGFNLTTVMNLIFMPLSIWYYRLGKKVNASMGM
ncbi:permease [Shewanella sp. E94]|uniref:permease n=1 Tax=Shewanella sp. E94 TaxID=2746933 RepID=UPI002DD62A3C|nr:permease [Shewanella sp. E94]MEC4736076.1 permease [Shewanella sp. E94]